MITLRDYLEGRVDEQQVYDFVIAKLREQGRASATSGTNACLYRGIDGAKCAVGWLIPDEEYRPNMESLCARKLISTHYPPAAESLLVRSDRTYFLQTLQHDVHDLVSAFPLEKFHQVLENYAKSFCAQHSLTYTPPGDVK